MTVTDTAKAFAQTMSDAIDVKYPENWVVLLMDTFTGTVDMLPFEKTDEGKNVATNILMVAALTLPLDVLVFTNIPNAVA